MKKNNIIKIIIILTIILSITIIYFMNIKNKDNKPKENNNIKDTTQLDTKINIDNGDEKIDWDSLKKETINLNNKSLTITEAGIYTINGKINNGNITIDTIGNIKLILNNISIKNNNGPAIIIENANTTVIELKDKTTNTLEDGKEYENNEYDGCLFSKDDLVIEGLGKLKIKSNYLDGIVSNDDLKIINGNITIDSNDDGIRGKDSVYIKDGSFKINSNGDGIKSTTDTDKEKGFIKIKNGTFTIESKKDAIQAETKLIIDNGTFNIKTGNDNSSSLEVDSIKGLKAKDNIIISTATINITSADDAIHSNKFVGIKSGTLNLSSNDDAIHADTEIIIDDGTINIEDSYEGIEAEDITINGGSITINTHDDGINISGGLDNTNMNIPPNEKHTPTSSTGILTINNGTININAEGDGIDVNGSIIINDGNLYIDGPTKGGNGILDYDNTFNINDGTLVAIGNRDMLQIPSKTSKNNTLIFFIKKNYTNEEITLEDENGNIIVTYTPKKVYETIIISSKKIREGNTYTLKINNKEITKLTVIDTINANAEIKDQHQKPPKGPGPRK